LGARIKAIRNRKGMTLAEVSARSGVAVSTLSRIESGQINASIDSVFRVARGLGVLFDNLMGPEPVPTAAARRVITRAGEAETLPTAFYDYRVHGGELVTRAMVPLVMRIKAREVPDHTDWSTHEGEEFVYVVAGTVRLHTEHYAPVTLAAGDSAYFDSLMRHAFVTDGDEDAEIVSVSLSDRRPARRDEGLDGFGAAPSAPLAESPWRTAARPAAGARAPASQQAKASQQTKGGHS